MAPTMESDSLAFFALLRELLRIRKADTSAALDEHLVCSGVDVLLASAEWRLFAPLVTLLLRENARSDRLLPPASRQALRRDAAHIAAADMARQQIVRDLGTRLCEAGVEVMLLKAAALSGWVYPEQAPRPGFDLDLLIRPEDRNRLTAAFAGFATARDKFPGKPHLARLAYEWSFWTQGKALIELDVHWALGYPALYPIDYHALWARSRPHPAYDVAVLRVPSPEDMVLHMALHAFYDLRGLSHHDLDTAILMQAEDIDWGGMTDRARSWGIAAATYFLLERVAWHLGAPVPDRVLDRLRPSLVRRRIGRWVLGGDTRRNNGARPPARRLQQLVSQLTMTGSLPRAVRFQLDYVQARLLDALLGRGKNELR